MDRIATLRDQINDLELQMKKLQASYEPTDGNYAYEALSFNQHVIDLIEEHRKMIATRNPNWQRPRKKRGTRVFHTQQIERETQATYSHGLVWATRCRRSHTL